jgi:hypothetical protein
VDKGKCSFGPNSQEPEKMILDGGVRTLSKVLKAYMDKAMGSIFSRLGKAK